MTATATPAPVMTARTRRAWVVPAIAVGLVVVYYLVLTFFLVSPNCLACPNLSQSHQASRSRLTTRADAGNRAIDLSSFSEAKACVQARPAMRINQF